jgi:hypothetical protein
MESMIRVVADLSAEKRNWVILDNECIHKKRDAWLTVRPNVFLRFKAASTSWLSQVEI